jgi:hypothetical protein
MTLPTVIRSRITCAEVLFVRTISKRGIIWAGLQIKKQSQKESKEQFQKVIYNRIHKRTCAYMWMCIIFLFPLKGKGNKKNELNNNLKKWAPTTRSWELIFSPIMLRSIVDVFVAKMQCGGHIFSRSLNISCLRLTFSITACKERTLILISF